MRTAAVPELVLMEVLRRHRRGRERGTDENSAKTESTFAQALPLFLHGGVFGFLIGAI